MVGIYNKVSVKKKSSVSDVKEKLWFEGVKA